jgi:trk/ktr system potassium uptake protein
MGKIPKRFVVVGAGKFGESVAVTLSKMGCEVMVLDVDKEKVQQLSGMVSQSIQMDAMDEKALRSVGIEESDVAVVSIGQQMEASILITMMLKEMGVPTVVTKAISDNHGKVLSRIGADRIVFPERDTGIKLANTLLSPTLSDYIEIAPGYQIIEVESPKALWNKTLITARVRSKYGIEIIAIKKNVPELDDAGETTIKEEVTIIPPAETIIAEGDNLVIIGTRDKIGKFRDKT